MTSFIYDNAKIWMDGIDYSGEGNSLAIEYGREPQDATGFGHTVRGSRLGVAYGVFSVSGYLNTTTNDVYTRHNSADTPIITAVDGGAVGDVSFFMQSKVAQFNPIDGGSVGDMIEFSFTAQTAPNGDIGNGKILQNAAITANGNTAIQSINEAGATSNQELKAALQVTAKSGTTPTLDEIVQGGTDSTMTLGARFVSQEAEITTDDHLKIIYGSPRFMMNDDTNVYVANDSGALSWTKYATGITGGSIRSLAFAALSPNTWVLGGTAGKVYTSTDNGATWTSRTSGTANGLNDIVYAESLFVAVGDSGTIITSPDGVTWTTRTSGTAQNLTAVYGDGTNFIAVGGNGVILKSADGITWSAATDSETETTNVLYGIYGDGTTWVASGNGGIVITSTDLDTWTTRTSGTTNSLRDVIKVASKFYISGGFGTIITSSDGITWTTVQTDSSVFVFYSMVSNGSDRIVTVGDSGAQYHSTGPIDLITFDQMTDIGSNGIKTLSGPFPFTHFRTSHTVGGSSPSFNTIVAAAVGAK